MTKEQSPPHLIQGPLRVDTNMGGITVEHDGASHFTFSLETVREVGVASLAEVMSHDVVHVAGLVSHSIRLVHGGLVHFAFNQTGQLVELSGSHARLEMTSTHCLSIRAMPAPVSA